MAGVLVRHDGRAVTVAPVRPEGAQIALVDLLDRLLGTGVVLSGDITISLAGVDLVEVQLHALIRSIRAEERR
ncbi:gas vesicle protein [Jiangella aurantiaca]|uniref:Gas vesicle protein n=1 Tax=Jiangella aurantiaca TaxID=2530373 RepID=A0A4R5AFA4_9ACTN|nr:gas vesicle protein [Jiangella aurantiaca]